MESACLFDAWLHEKTSYTYNGDAPITGLTQFELDKLELGFLIQQERAEEQRETAEARSIKPNASRAAARRKAERLKRERGIQ